MNNTNQSGQVLLIIILLASILLTVGLSLTKISSDDTQSSKLTDDQNRAYAAAEAGIDAVVNQNTEVSENDFPDLFSEGTDITGSAVFITTTSTSFTTPVISKDALYTFYLTGYDEATNQPIDISFNDSLTINRATPSGTYCGTAQEFAVEIIFINLSQGIVSRKAIDECSLINGNTDETSFGTTITTSSLNPDPQLMIIRLVGPDENFDGARLVIKNESGNNWPLQGRTIRSTATTAGNVTKTIDLFQSYPQFISEFFVTSF